MAEGQRAPAVKDFMAWGSGSQPQLHTTQQGTVKCPEAKPHPQRPGLGAGVFYFPGVSEVEPRQKDEEAILTQQRQRWDWQG